jgi:RimJ/RimL family protein N-acetyltransferase
MTQRTNKFGQPVGEALPDWQPVSHPPRTPMEGRYCRTEAFDVDRHGSDLYEAYAANEDGSMWTYMPSGPFADEAAFLAWMGPACESEDPLFYTLIDTTSGKAVGQAAYLRITPAHGVIEVGNIAFSPRLQRTPIATEAMFLMMQRVFNELGYRRYEWKCDSCNTPSRRAAERFGFTYDGLFPQAIVYKGRNRDTTWFSIIDKDWPATERAYQAWLDPENFDANGQQKQKLSDLIAANRTD